MSKKLIYLISFVLLLGALQAGPAEAQSVEFEFGGIVTDVQLGLDPPWDQVNVNDQLSIVYTFDPTTTDSTPSATRGDYYFTITSYTLTIGSVIDSNSNPSGVAHISVFNNRPPAFDQYEVKIPGLGGQYYYYYYMQFNGPNTIWDSDELPLCGDIELSDFSGIRHFRLSDLMDPFGGEIYGSVDYHRCSSCTPLEAHNPIPADDANCVNPNVVLSWSPGCAAESHNVYLGLDPNALALVATKPLGDESYAPGPLEPGTTYYWRIDEVNGVDVWVGDVWSFTVGYGTSTWTDSGGDALWCTPGNWDPVGVPRPCDEAIIDLPDSTCLVDCNATCYKLTVGLDNGPCLLNMNSGTLSVATDFIVGENAGSDGTVTLSGGVINTHTFGMRTSGGTGTMDMTSGTLLIDGNEVPTINGYVGNGWITAYGGTGTVFALYHAATDKTLVTAVPAPGEGAQWVYMFTDVPDDPPPPPEPVDVNMYVYGTVNCTKLQPPLEIEEHLIPGEIYGMQYTGPIIPGINDLLLESNWLLINGNGGFIGIACKIAVPDWTNVPMPYWELAELAEWVEGYVVQHVSLPSLWDPTGDIPDIYVVANPAVWQENPRPLRKTYEIVNGECYDLPGYLIGTTPIIFDRNAGPEENPFSTTRLTCTLYRNSEISLIPHALPAPAPPGNPTPAQGATNVSTTADLRWTAGTGATSHNVYFGTSSPGIFRGNQLGRTFDPGTMEYETRYYWRIDEVAPGGTTTGDVWSFDTGTSSNYMKMDPPPDVDKSAHGHVGTGTCWLATAANMLAGAGYGNGVTVQERADDIYGDLVTWVLEEVGSLNYGGWADTAITWWLGSDNNVWTYNTYNTVTVYGNKGIWNPATNMWDKPPWPNPNGARYIANELRTCEMVGLSISWPIAGVQVGVGGHAITAWGDELGCALLSGNPSTVKVTDSDSDNGGDVQTYTYDSYTNPNPAGYNEGHGWYINYNYNHPYIKHIITLCPTEWVAGHQNTQKVVGSVRIHQNDPNRRPAKDLHYQAATDVSILSYKTTIDWPTSSSPSIIEGDPLTSITVDWDLQDNPIPYCTDVIITTEIVVPRWNALFYSDIYFTYPEKGPIIVPELQWQIDTPNVIDYNIPSITGGYVVGSFDLIDPCGPTVVAEYRLLHEYDFEQDPELHYFTLRADPNMTEPLEAGNFRFGHSYGFLETNSLWQFHDWMTRIPVNLSLASGSEINFTLDWDDRLPYPPGENYLGQYEPPECTEYLREDLNKDCVVNFKDLALIAGVWLEETYIQ